MPPSRSLLNQPINLEYTNSLYTHASSTGNIHGLPSGANVLGDKSGTGRFIGTQQQTSSLGDGPFNGGYNSGTTFSHPVAFTSAPKAFISGAPWYSPLCALTIAQVDTTTYKAGGIGYSGYCASMSHHLLVVGS